jgi:hypothetical protein
MYQRRDMFLNRLVALFMDVRDIRVAHPTLNIFEWLQFCILEMMFGTQRSGFDPGSGQVGFVVNKVALGRVLFEYFGFPCQSSFHQILHHHNHPGQVQ